MGVYWNEWTRSPKGDKRKWRFAGLVLVRIANDEESVRRMKEKRRKAEERLGRQVATIRYSRRTSILLEHLSTWNLISFVHRRLFTLCRILSLLFSIHSVYITTFLAVTFNFRLEAFHFHYLFLLLSPGKINFFHFYLFFFLSFSAERNHNFIWKKIFRIEIR